MVAQLISPITPHWRKAVPAITLTAFLLVCLLLAASPNLAAFTRDQAELLSQSNTVRVVTDGDYYDTLTGLIKNAGHRIDLAMFLFKTSPGHSNRPAALIRDLVAARQRGVEVRVILEYSGHDPSLNRANQETAQILKKGGVAVFFDSPRRTNHAKLAVIDNRYCLVGSHNLTQSALKYNHEFSLMLDNTALAEEILAYLETILP
jgi:phosphatidylserine/phosphatidylglycerophosphate/cardiolipin synthase-like enzyme